MPARMSDEEHEAWRTGQTYRHMGLTIKPKNDFGQSGYWDPKTRSHIKEGWIVSDGIAEVLPGAIWATNLKEVNLLISCYQVANGSSDQFWLLVKAAQERQLKEELIGPGMELVESQDAEDTEADYRTLHTALGDAIEQLQEMGRSGNSNAPASFVARLKEVLNDLDPDNPPVDNHLSRG